MVLTILQPSVHEMHTATTQVSSLLKTNTLMKRRLDEMEFVFQKMQNNSSRTQDTLTRFEDSTAEMKATEQRMKDKIRDLQREKDVAQNTQGDERTTFMQIIDNLEAKIDAFKEQMVSYQEHLTRQYVEKIRHLEVQSRDAQKQCRDFTV